MVNYGNGKIYRLISKCGLIYIGSTTQLLSKRLSCHKSRFLEGLKDYSSRFLFEKDIDTKIFLIENFACENKEQLLMRERYHIENTDCVNIRPAFLTKEEFILKKKEWQKKGDKKYREKNWEYLNYQIIECECGSGFYNSKHIARHRQSNKHIKSLLKVQLE
jgi:hypothetical protein